MIPGRWCNKAAEFIAGPWILVGFCRGLHGHGDQSADQNCGEKLANDGFGDGQRAGEGMNGQNVAKTDGGESRKTEIDQIGRELVNVRGLGDEVESAGMELFDNIKCGSPGHAEKKISADAALNAAPGHGALAKHYEQDDTDIEQQDDGGKNGADYHKERCGIEARSPQQHGTDDHQRNRHHGDNSILFGGQRARNHQRDHDEIEEDSAGKASLAQRKDHEDQNDEREGNKRQSDVARPELANVHLQDSGARMRIVGHRLARAGVATRVGRNYSCEGRLADKNSFDGNKDELGRGAPGREACGESSLSVMMTAGMRQTNIPKTHIRAPAII